MPDPRFAKQPVRPDVFVRMAWAPSYRAPRASDVLRPRPFVPLTNPSWDELGARDLVEREGRVESVSLSGRSFITLAAPRFEKDPPREVRLVAVKWYLDELAECPHLAKVERLNLRGNRIGPEGIRILCRSPFLSPRHLDLTFNDLGSAGVMELIAAPWSSGLQSLNLAGNDLTENDRERVRATLQAVAVDTIG
jgi:hypothetical protein